MSGNPAPEGGTGVGLARADHFATVAQQRAAATLGLWLWLLTELLLFSALFLVALVVRIQHPEATVAATRHLKFWIGAANTVVLIGSSLTMSMAIAFSRIGWQRAMVRAMLVTAALGGLFLALKGYEYRADFEEHMMPFLAHRPFALDGMPAARLIVNLYYAVTGLHALHLVTGIAVLLGMAWMAAAEGFLARHQNRIEVYGLYWHFIDLVWILAFTILYVVNR